MATAAGIGDGDRQRPASPARSRRAWAGEPRGTRFAPAAARYSSFKLWLKYAKPSHGRVVVDAGAARALREGGTTLLPVGIVEVEGALRRRRRGRGRATAAADDRQGDLQLLGGRAAPGQGPEVGRRCARCSRAPPRRPSTATTSCWPEGCRVTCRHGRRRPLGRRCLPAPRRPRRARWPRLDSATKDRALRGDRRRAGGAHAARSSRPTRATSRPAAAAGLGRRADGPPARWTRARVAAMADGVRAIVALPDPVGEVIDGSGLPNGLDVRKVRVPLGVVAVVYEARPERDDRRRRAGAEVGQRDRPARLLAGGALQRRAGGDRHRGGRRRRAARRRARPGRAAAGARSWPSWPARTGVVDLIIPRGGEGLKKALSAVATVPVIYAASGNCHVYVDAGADLDAAEAIVLNAKTQRPGVVQRGRDAARARATSPPSSCRARSAALREAGVELRADGRARAALGAGRRPGRRHRGRLGHEFLALVLAVRRRGLASRRRSSTSTAYGSRALGGDRDARSRQSRAGVPAGRGRRLRLRQRLHPLHRRRRVRDGRRDRQLDAEAARPRPDRAARAVHLQVPGRGLGPGPRP